MKATSLHPHLLCVQALGALAPQTIAWILTGKTEVQARLKPEIGKLRAPATFL
jgi:hypothetical protein